MGERWLFRAGIAEGHILELYIPLLLVGALHAVFTSTVLVNVILPVIHRRIGTPETAANEIALIEPPGFLMLNYGRNTFVVTLVSHAVYGAIVGWAVRV